MDEVDTLAAALRQKYKTPMEALQALGLDAALIEEIEMPSPQTRTRQPPKLSPAAAITKSALWTFLTPRLAQDASINYGALVSGITSKNYAQKLPGLTTAVVDATKGKLAQDADITDLANLLNALKPDAQNADQAVTAPGAGPPMGGGAPPPPVPTAPPADGEPEDTLAKIKKYLEQEGVSPDIINNLDAFMAEGAGGPPNGGGGPPNGGGGGPPGGGSPPDGGDEGLEVRGECSPGDLIEDEDEEERKRRELAGEDAVVPSEQKDLITRDAMNKAIKQAQDSAIKTQREIRAAERFVRPWVGEMAMDSATQPSDVLRAALKALNVPNAEKMHADALRPVLEAQPKPTRRIAQDRVHAAAGGLAADGKPVGSFAERFPDAQKITVQ